MGAGKVRIKEMKRREMPRTGKKRNLFDVSLCYGVPWQGNLFVLVVLTKT